MIKNHDEVDICIGVDFGKSNHHAFAIDRKGKKLLDRALPQDEAKLRAIIKAVAGKGTLLLVVDPPSTIGGCIPQRLLLSARPPQPKGGERRDHALIRVDAY